MSCQALDCKHSNRGAVRSVNTGADEHATENAHVNRCRASASTSPKLFSLQRAVDHESA